MKQITVRTLNKVVNAVAAHDGDGVKINRVAGHNHHKMMDPFLMVDEINSDEASDYIGGFPSHPHRGFETITYMKAGRMRHKDHMGNDGLIERGDVQWMTAGKGVIHSEMPEQENGLLHGFQIWLNLPANEKMKPAAYRELKKRDIPCLSLPTGGSVNSVAGEVSIAEQSIVGPLPAMKSEPIFLDVMLMANEQVELKFNAHNPVLVFVYQGSSDKLTSKQMGYYSEGDLLSLTAGQHGMQALVLSGRAINEPIVQYGPFVMNTRDEIDQAISDFQNNRLA